MISEKTEVAKRMSKCEHFVPSVGMKLIDPFNSGFWLRIISVDRSGVHTSVTESGGVVTSSSSLFDGMIPDLDDVATVKSMVEVVRRAHKNEDGYPSFVDNGPLVSYWIYGGNFIASSKEMTLCLALEGAPEWN